MSDKIIGFGGGCHWCTEAVFQSLVGVSEVQQGWIASEGEFSDFSEAVKLKFDPHIISLHTLIEIHLLTHASSAEHSMREKYRSAIYFADSYDEDLVKKAFSEASKILDSEVITKILPLIAFKQNDKEFLNYYQTRPAAPFCKNHIAPKLTMLQERFTEKIKSPNKS